MLFDDLSQEEADCLESVGVLKHYPRGAVIIEEGMAGTSFIVLLSGQAEVRKAVSGGRFKKLLDLHTCDVIGEVAFLGANFRTASVVAVSDCEVLEFERSSFEAMSLDHPAVGVKVYRGMAQELARRLATSDRNLMDVMARNIRPSHRAPLSQRNPAPGPVPPNGPSPDRTTEIIV